MCQLHEPVGVQLFPYRHTPTPLSACSAAAVDSASVPAIRTRMRRFRSFQQTAAKRSRVCRIAGGARARADAAIGIAGDTLSIAFPCMSLCCNEGLVLDFGHPRRQLAPSGGKHVQVHPTDTGEATSVRHRQLESSPAPEAHYEDRQSRLPRRPQTRKDRGRGECITLSY